MRLLIVSNRLPVSLQQKQNDFTVEKSAGGLVSGLSDYLASLGKSSTGISEYIWIGWPGVSVGEKHRETVRKSVGDYFNSSPVFLSEKLMEKVYLGFCNKTIWPIFHYFPNYAVFDPEYWEEYKRVNEIFRDELIGIIQPDDIIWIHDYHLMLLPRMLREKVSNPIGFFLHIPFPTYEVFRMLPHESRRGLLHGLLGADLVGFHTHDYSQYFLRCVLRILGYEHHMGRIDMPGREVKVDTFPMGVDYEKFNKMEVAVPHPEVPERKDMKIVISVDRLDYSKGILNRLKGFELFLKKNPQWHGKVCLSMIVVPSRIGVNFYQEIKSSLDELVGNINGAYGSFRWTPVIYQYTSLPHETLVSMFRMSDAALLTPLRDGMNLVAKEYVASRNDRRGVLILSEFTGASKELSESIIINPNSIDEIADAIKLALTIPVNEQICKNDAMQSRLKRYNITRWASDFVDALITSRNAMQLSLFSKMVNEQIIGKLTDHYRNSRERLIIANYDGTLVPLSNNPQNTKPSPRLIELITDIRERSGTDMVILSGRSKENLERWFGKIPVNLTAEHGSWIKEQGSEWDQLKPLSGDWKADILPILEIYTDRLPGSKIKEKDYSLSWHYGNSDIEQASYISRELADHLISITATIGVQIFQGNKVLEITNSGINKGDLARHWLEKKNYDFVLAIGAGWSDELLFRSLNDDAWTMKVGLSRTDAKYILNRQTDVVSLLSRLI